MSVNKYKLKKWLDMLLGKSIHHVNQDEGKAYSISEIRGYYNNLTEKVTKSEQNNGIVPKSYIDSGEQIYFSIEIFQYGLALYDLYLLNQDEKMLRNAIVCADWALENQEKKGSWKTFDFDNPLHPYSSMAQAEGISLLARIYLETGEIKYFESAKKAVDFMLIPLTDGGTAEYKDEKVYFYERTEDPLVLNGWIFSYWGLLDYWKLTKDKEIKCILDKTLSAMIEDLPSYDIGYWSKYDAGRMICSPFYHKLHIAQLNVMYDLTKEKIFKTYAILWTSYRNSFIKSKKAFIIKIWQKVFE
ncbi:D-glucuronyl C5-epimerase family protein [uncultured Eubacterium sp.]|uniref:D-glucuronyl C5-epimerase family protein n=1 Tax=uncultured Eubacterium sp. TaxID=165185 RepID=UPI0025CC6436|nr:D-glucuronyl C5-epimerase family protein [uncultured Eubacterium sp.]